MKNITLIPLLVAVAAGCSAQLPRPPPPLEVVADCRSDQGIETRADIHVTNDQYRQRVAGECKGQDDRQISVQTNIEGSNNLEYRRDYWDDNPDYTYNVGEGVEVTPDQGRVDYYIGIEPKKRGFRGFFKGTIKFGSLPK